MVDTTMTYFIRLKRAIALPAIFFIPFLASSQQVPGVTISPFPGNRFALLDSKNGQRLNATNWTEAEAISNRLMKVFNDGRFYILSSAGSVINTDGYDEIRSFQQGRAAFSRKGLWGFINEAGAEVIAPAFKMAYDYRSPGIAAVFTGTQWQFIDVNGKFIVRNRSIFSETENKLFDGLITIADETTLQALNNKRAAGSSSTGYRPQSALTTAPCPPNIDFEAGNFSNWSCFTGNTSCTAGVNTVNLNPSAPTAGRHTIITRTTPSPLDFYGQFPVNPPDGTNYCVKLGNTATGSQAEGISYTITVPANVSNYSITYQYAVVFQDPGHTNCQQPRFTAKLFDPLTNTYLPCGTFEYISTSSIPGFSTSPVDASVRFKSWSRAYINLSPYAGRTLQLEFTTADCTLGAHWGYAYLEVENNCSLTAGVNYRCLPPSITTLTGPPGFQTYNWWSFDFSTLLGTTQTLTLNPSPPIGTSMWVEVIPYSGLGCRDTLPVNIQITYPAADFTTTLNQCLRGNNFIFNSTSLIASGNIVDWQWDFGDGNTAAGTTVSHSYAAASTYNVKLVVTAATGCKDSITKQVTVSPMPVALFSSPPGQCRNGNSFTFTSNSTITPGSVALHQWEFGDGNTGTGISVTHSYAAEGQFNVRLIAVSADGCKDTIIRQVTVFPKPNPSFVPPAAQCKTNNLFSFTSTSAISSGSITTLNWDFGDGSSGSGINVSHSYAAPGQYTVKLLTMSALGCKDSVSSPVTVWADPLSIITTDKPPVFCSGDSVHLIASSSPGSGTITSYQWFLNTTTIPGATGNTITVLQSGSYQLQTINSNGCKATSATTAVIVNPLPVGNLSIPSVDFICEGSSVILNASSNGGTFEWSMNGNPVPGNSGPVYTATQPGNYSVTYISPQGCRTKANSIISLTLIKKPVADFDFPVRCMGLPIQFTNRSDTTASGIATWAWDFGDGAHSALYSPAHIFNSGIKYSVTLTATSVKCPDLSASITKIVKVDAPRWGIRYPTVNAVINANTQLVARNFGQQYLWSPAAGLSNATIYNPVYNYNKETDYFIRIETATGCVTIDSVLVRVFKQADILVPKAFSPNGDGHNDRLQVFLIGIKKLNFFMVYNRWGQLMFETTDPSRLWDGTYHGQPQPLETYVWIADATGLNDEKIIRRGQTALLR